MQASLVFYVLLAVARDVTFQQKLEHLKSYVIPTKSSVESDRPIMEGLVAKLLDGLDLTIRSFECLSRPTPLSQRRTIITLPVASLSLSPEDRLAVRSVRCYVNHEDCLETFNDNVRGIFPGVRSGRPWPRD